MKPLKLLDPPRAPLQTPYERMIHLLQLEMTEQLKNPYLIHGFHVAH